MQIKKIYIAVLVVLFAFPVYAQHVDTVNLLKEFINISSGYKQLPLQLQMDYKKSTNLPLQEEDTASFQAHFHIQQEGAYINFGDMEQLVNDTTSLMIMHSIKQMILTVNRESSSSILKAMTGPGLPDSVVDKFKSEFIINKTADAKMGMMLVKSKRMIPGTQQPFQQILLKYDLKTRTPATIETNNRSLVPVDPDVQPDARLQIVVLDGNRRFAIKEDNSSYVYNSIKHEAGIRLPYLMSDRIMTDKDANIVPVKAYEHYLLTQH